MKVLMTADGAGGVWTYAVELARGLLPHRVEILLATSGGSLSAAQRTEVSELPNVRLMETTYKLEWMPDPWDDVTAFGELLQDLAADFQPDVIHLNEYSQGALHWEQPTLVVGHSCVCSWFENVRGHAAPREWDEYRRRVTQGLRSADLVASPTRFMLSALERHYGSFRASCVVPNGYTPPARAAATGSRERFVFAAGRWWDEAKNIAVLGRVAAMLPWPVRVAGLPSPEGSKTELPSNVVNLGRLDTAGMSAQYANAAIYCLPARYEPFGLTPLEAAAHGCALVLGDIPSLREVWGEDAAFVAPGDADALAFTLRRLLGRGEERQELALRARTRAGRYSREQMARDYLGVYETLIHDAALVMSSMPEGAA